MRITFEYKEDSESTDTQSIVLEIVVGRTSEGHLSLDFNPLEGP